jgi:NAD-dependent deacetylase
MQQNLEPRAARLRSAKRVLVLTGAGISAESGIPTFRGAGGWYRNRPAHVLASPEGFAESPETVWEWYDYRRQLIARAQPNAAHHALHDWEQHAEVIIVTQNVDDLHERAGSSHIFHVHGSIWRVRCLSGCPVTLDERAPLPELPPRCSCGALLRPDVVWFGEQLPVPVLQQIEQSLQTPFDLALVVGTGADFGYIQSWARRARAAGALLLDVNPDVSQLTAFSDAHLAAPAGEVLPQLTELLQS